MEKKEINEVKTKIDEMIKDGKDSNDNSKLVKMQTLDTIGKDLIRLGFYGQALTFLMPSLDIHRLILPAVDFETAELLFYNGLAHNRL